MAVDLSYIAAPVDKALIRQELNEERFVRKANKGDNEIYIVNIHNSPNVLKEIGRLREVTFATSGGGTGEPLDLDEHDTDELCYEQLVLYNPEEEEIVGGYRFIDCRKIMHTRPMFLSTRHYFDFSDKFREEYIPYTIELGRSWIQPNYQPSVNARKGIFTLDNLWDGLGAIAVDNPNIKHFFGKMTMYPDYHKEARDALLYFLDHYFEDRDKLVSPIYPMPHTTDIGEFVDSLQGLDFKEGHRVLQRYVKERGETIPPLFNAYMQLSPTMKCFGTAENPDFGDVEETGILVTIADIYPEKKERHIATYTPKA